MTTEKWRQFTKADAEDFAGWLSGLMDKAPIEAGGFEGDPIERLTKAAMENFFIISFAMRQRDEERANRPPYMSKLGDLLQKLVWSLQSGVMMKEATIDLDGITFKVIGTRLDHGDRPFEFKITMKEKVKIHG